jgi:RimJ/RimL family protein N-acetyltransferase
VADGRDDAVSGRLELRPATVAVLDAAIAGPAALAAALGARVPDSWPPDFLDEPALVFTRDRLRAYADEAAWWMHFVIVDAGADDESVLVGTAGYKGPPGPDGTVEVGYAVVSDYRRRGLATAATRELVRRAFARPDVRLVVAQTLPELVGSQGVLSRCGFRLVGPGSEQGALRFELARAGGGTGERGV